MVRVLVYCVFYKNVEVVAPTESRTAGIYYEILLCSALLASNEILALLLFVALV